MTECKFVFRFSKGGNSDSVIASYKLHTVPRPGDNLLITGDDGNEFMSEVKEIVHSINPSKGSHEIRVFHG